MTLKQILPIWWTLFWRGFLFWVLVVSVLGFFSGVLVAIYEREDLGRQIVVQLGWVAMIPASYFALKSTIKAYNLRPSQASEQSALENDKVATDLEAPLPPC